MKGWLLKRISSAFFLQNIVAKVLALIPSMVDHNMGKYMALKKAFFLTSLEGLEGDYLEFGVFTGSSLQAAIEFSKHPALPRNRPVRFVGFDSFQGFGELKEKDEHPFYKDLNFETNKDRVERRLRKLIKDPTRVKLVDGFFEQTLKGKKPSDYGVTKTTVVMIDCDTFSASELVFNFIADAFQEGTILIIDDFFSYKGDPTRGTCGAFNKFKENHPEWQFRRVYDYGCGGAVFMTCRKNSSH